MQIRKQLVNNFKKKIYIQALHGKVICGMMWHCWVVRTL